MVVDIGTTKITALAGEKNENGKIVILGQAKVASRGIKRGVVINPEEFAGALRSLGLEEGEMEKVRSIFLDFERTDDYRLAWRSPDRQSVLDMLCGEYGFSEKRVNGALDKFSSGKKDQMRLDMF